MKNKLPFTKEQALKWREIYPTPFYVYDEAEISSRVKSLYKAFSWNPGFREYFAVKATPTPAILRLLSGLGCGADCASVQELELAKRCHMPMILSSNETQRFEYAYAAKCGAIINLDDFTQIENMEKAIAIPDTICMRYNAGKMNFPDEYMGDCLDSKFGMMKEQVFDAVGILKEKGVKHFGFHGMHASGCLNPVYYPTLAREMFRLVLEIREKCGITAEFIDLSGGIGIPYTPYDTEVDIIAIGEGVRKAYEEILTPAGVSLSIFTELGRWVTGPCGYLVSTVVGHKHIFKEYVGLDTCACDLMRPAMYSAYHHINVLGKEDAPLDTIVDVVGSLCENNDKFAVNRPLPETQVGDMVVIQDAGAHGHSMGYNYNSRLRCAEFMLKKDGSLEMIRRAETMQDYFAVFDIDEEFNA